LSTCGRISIKGLEFTYPGSDEPALKDVNVSFEQGMFYVVIGRNGSGKTTLAKCLNALLTPTKGSVISCGFDTSCALHQKEVRKKVSIVFQNPQTQIIGTTVEEDVAFGPENIRLEPEKIQTRVRNALERAGIPTLSKQNPHNLSMGEKQLVAVAGALAMEPRFIVSDESTSMLDYPSRERMLRLFKDLTNQGIGVIHITHFIEECLTADRLMLLDKGKMIANGEPREILRNTSLLASCGIEPPFVSLICSELLSMGYPVPEKITTVEEILAWFSL